jgi:two-component system, OmpR family, alkaline phosphatase synthesis response regulator PhoP
MAGTILLVEDEPSVGELVRGYLQRDGYRVLWVRSGEDALVELERHQIRELVARMKAIFRRTEPQDRRERLSLGDVELDRESHDVTVDGRAVELTAKEFDLLAFFMSNAGVVVSRDVLLDRVWGQEYPGGTRTVDVHVAQLRRKLDRPDLIRTLRGTGYKAISQ